MSRLNLNLQTVESFEYFRKAVLASYDSYTCYKYIEGEKSWIVYTELVPELVLTYEITKDTEEEDIFLSEINQLDYFNPRKRVDVDIHDEENEQAISDLNIAIQAILCSLDGYALQNDLNSLMFTVSEHYIEYSTAIYAILNSLDGYVTKEDFNGLSSTVSEHYTVHSDAIKSVIKDLDGYALEDDLNGLSSTVSEHYSEHSDAIQVVLNSLDGYIESFEKGIANGVATLDSGGKIPATQIPAVSLPEVYVVYDDTERLALDVQEGDEAIQTNDGYHYIYDGDIWHIRPVNPHNPDHYVNGTDPIVAQNLSSDSAVSGKIMETDGTGGWNLVDKPSSGTTGLSNITYDFAFLRNGKAKNTWLSLYEHTIVSYYSPAIIPWKSKLTGITFSNNNYGADTDIMVFVSNAGSGHSFSLVYTWEIQNSRIAYKTDFLSDIIVDAGDKVAVYVRDQGTDTKDPVIKLYFNVTEDATTGSGSENFFSPNICKECELY